MKTTISIFLSILIITGLFLGINALADETDDITAEDLEVTEQKTLPGNFFYFFKNLWRDVKVVLTFNPVKKAELRLRHANEKLIEAKMLAEKTGKEELVGKAIERYEKEIEKVKERVESFKEKASENPKIEAFLTRFADRAIKQEILIEKLEENLSHNPEALEKIKAAKQRVLENHSEVIERLEQNKETIRQRLEEIMQEQRPELKQRLEQYRERIQERVENIIKNKETGCKNQCGDGTCQEMTCLSTDCPCSETIVTCPIDCATQTQNRVRNK